MHKVAGAAAGAGPEAVRAELERIIAAEPFQRSARSVRFLRYVVEQVLAGRAGSLKEYVIALEVFDRPSSYDPHVDATVRVEAGKLRARLQKYYDTIGTNDPVRIEIPKGTYVPVFISQGVEPPKPKEVPPSKRKLLVLLAVALAFAAFAVLKPWNEPALGSEAWAEMQYGSTLIGVGTLAGVEKGLQHLRRAVALEPNSAAAHAELAHACFKYVEANGVVLPRLLDEADTEAQKAIQLDRSNARAHFTLGLTRLLRNMDWPGAERELRYAVEAGAEDSYTHSIYARLFLIPRGRFDEAIRQFEAVLRIDPTSSVGNTHLGAAYLRKGQIDQAIPQLRTAFDMYPTNPGTLVWLGIAEFSRGRFDEAIHLYKQALRISPGFVWALGHLGYLYGKRGRRREAEAVIDEIKRIPKDVPGEWDLAAIYAGLGDRDAAFEQLEAAFSRRVVNIIFLNVELRLMDLHGDVRFVSLLERMKLQ